MSVSETIEDVTKIDHSPRKRVRHRKKKLYEDILKQMEFYFSDANLTKDRFLGELIKNDPYVPIETFLKFNKIRSMTTDMVIIAKAMKNSTFLELSEDKLKVKRKSPILSYDADARTVYVESIPVTATREWLQKVFSEFGHVAYISLPKFKNSRIKGYAFIEFGKPEEAQKCISAFTKMGCKLPTCMPPEELSSIKMFSVEEPMAESPVKKDEEAEDLDHEPPKKKHKKHKDKKGVKHLELKLHNESDSEKKVETPTDDNKSIVSTPTEEHKADIGISLELASHDEGKSDEEMKRKKKPRKKVSKDKGKANGLSKPEAPPGALWGLQVLAKSEWKSLRNKYLNLQRKYMKDIKTKLRSKRQCYSNMPAPAEPALDVEPAINTREMEGMKNLEPLKKIPGVFVKDILPEPCLDVRLAKRTIRTNVHALHVDIKEGQTEAIIRFDSAEAAEEYCNNTTKAQVLRGSEEEQQWARAEAARSGGRRRGRANLLARHHAAPSELKTPASPQPTHTHIRFDE